MQCLRADVVPWSVVVGYSGALQPGDSLGKYEIVRELAIGGQARIYLARVRGTAGFEKQIVLKCILESLATDNQFVQMFLEEARLAATLRHSNIADVIDVGVERGIYYFAMEYVAGKTARDIRIRAKELKKPPPLEVSLAIIAGTAAALEYAHNRTDGAGKPLEIVHRDVSPTNILVSYEGAIKLVDFGIARATLRRGRTRTGLKKGKVPYMSPEQCRGQTVDRRSDLFSLGTVLYELTTGVRPFLGSSELMVLDQIVTGHAEPPSRLVANYPPALEAIALRALTRAPGARYQTAAAMLEDIERFIAESSLLTSSHIVARYMNELFTDPDTSPFERDTIMDLPRSRVPSDDEPTWTPELKVTFAPGREYARQDPPLELEILEQVAVNASTQDRIVFLLDRALAYVQEGELEKAITAVELALDENNEELLQRNVATIVQVYEAILDDPYRSLTLAASANGANLEPQARALAAHIDGRISIAQLLQQSGMHRVEAYRHLCQLMVRGFVY
jgi:serine/threonine protein kinase